jgi:hypothetical protein
MRNTLRSKFGIPMIHLAYHHPSNRKTSSLITGTFTAAMRTTSLRGGVMKAYFANLPMRVWLLMVVPTVVIAYPVSRIVIPAVVHAVVPEVVRNVLSFL